MKLNLVTLPLITLLMVGCAGLSGSGASRNAHQPTPISVSAERKAFIETEVEWGGIIARTDNLVKTTEIEIIAYPLTKSGRPDIDSTSIGRFIATHEGYLETLDYAKGRRVTVNGMISGVRRRMIKKSEIVFPELSVTEIRLWTKGSEQRRRPTFHIGIGGGSGHAHGGIGIGF